MPPLNAARLSIVFAIACATLVACGGRNARPDEALAGERYVRTVIIRGADKIDAGKIKDGLGTRSPDGVIFKSRIRFDPAVVEKDRARIESYYQRRGFFDASVDRVAVRKLANLQTDVTFFVREGKPSRVTDIVVEGAAGRGPVSNAALRRAISVERGKRFEYVGYEAAKTTLLTRLLEAGHAYASVDGRAEVDRDKKTVVLRYIVVPGPVVTLGEVSVTGNKTVPESAIRNRVTFSPGQPYTPAAISQTRSRIRGLGRFGVVRVDLANKQPTEVAPIRVTVSESPRREIRLGGGAGLDDAHYELRGRAGYSLMGFLHPLITLSTEIRPALTLLRGQQDEGISAVDPVFEARADLTREDLFVALLRGRAGFVLEREALEAYTSLGQKFTLGLSRPFFGQKLRVGAGAHFETLTFQSIASEIDDDLRRQLGLNDFYRLGYYQQSVALDLRDNPINATSGVYLELRLEEATFLFASEFDYIKITPEVRGYLPLGDYVVAAARARAGHTLRGTLPISRRYFLGGSTSQRGFGQRRLAPVAGDIETSKVAIGGEQMVEGSAEVRLDVWRLWGNWLGVVGFVDAGDVADTGDTVDISRLHVATGGGLRYQTPVGPIRFDLGYRLNRFGAGELSSGDRLSWHLTIGEAF